MKESTLLAPPLRDYMLAHSQPLDAVQRRLIERTSALVEVAHWQTAPEQSALITLLVRLLGARNAVDVGSFTGMSSLAIARGMGPDGRVVACDVTDKWTEVAREAWQTAGVADRIELRVAPAIETLRALPSEPYLDFSFVDADKEGYQDYFEELVVRTRPGGLIAFDNFFRSGRVLKPVKSADHAVIEFNARLVEDERVEVVVLPIADGMSLAYRK
ncbi:caffeoyl-CoA O-methyltransferase [Lentzea fradiae]|uniref:Caffeoyl-CoA O-methyltransferase n=1 Tax=Lentzea fradiae TaxID=200378 RepID=A0A1G7XJ94_9PSEU|nr:O-methyltransferase [Lentzea fradiae]SDG83660.1 caffeoyl-CoA O-methyltransferase [Lentzea fradiae]